MNDLARWINDHPDFYQPYWEWVSIIGAVAAIGWFIDNVRSIIRWHGDSEIWPLRLQAIGQSIAAVIVIAGLGAAARLGNWVVNDRTAEARLYFVPIMLLLITGYALLMVALWGMRRIALWRAREF